MDPFSMAAGVVGLLDVISKFLGAISQFKHDYALADEDLDLARQHALLLAEEIRSLDGSPGPSPIPDDSPLAKALTTSHVLLSEIEAAFRLRSEPHNWKSRVRWAMGDRKTFVRLQERLRATESTLQGIVAMENLRVLSMVYKALLRQQEAIERLSQSQVHGDMVVNMTVIATAENILHSDPAIVEAELSEIRPPAKGMTKTMPGPIKTVPRARRFSGWGFSTQFTSLSKADGTSYGAVTHVSLLGKMYSVRLQVSYPKFSFERSLHVCNIVPDTSDIAIACKEGSFEAARRLIESNAAGASDVTASGTPMLELAIESGSASVVSLLLEHGADPNILYGDFNMSGLHSCFLRGRLDMAQMLLARGADLGHVDGDGYSVLSYLWVVVDGQAEAAAAEEFMGLCLTEGFTEVDSCDNRGWTAFHRAAAVGKTKDVDAFLRLGASLELRAEWYGWTPLFFAASHDNVETFLAIIRHAGDHLYRSLDGDGWTLLHCCVYFKAPQVMRLVLKNGIDVNQRTHPAPLPEDPELSYKKLTAAEIALYIGTDRYDMFMDALVETEREGDLEGDGDVFWDADDGPDDKTSKHAEGLQVDLSKHSSGADDNDRWNLLHWASYNGSAKIRQLLLLKGMDREHVDAIMLEKWTPSLMLPARPFDGCGTGIPQVA